MNLLRKKNQNRLICFIVNYLFSHFSLASITKMNLKSLISSIILSQRAVKNSTGRPIEFFNALWDSVTVSFREREKRETR